MPVAEDLMEIASSCLYNSLLLEEALGYPTAEERKAEAQLLLRDQAWQSEQKSPPPSCLEDSCFYRLFPAVRKVGRQEGRLAGVREDNEMDAAATRITSSKRAWLNSNTSNSNEVVISILTSCLTKELGKIAHTGASLTGKTLPRRQAQLKI